MSDEDIEKMLYFVNPESKGTISDECVHINKIQKQL